MTLYKLRGTLTVTNKWQYRYYYRWPGLWGIAAAALCLQLQVVIDRTGLSFNTGGVDR